VSEQIRLILADDHSLVRKGVEALLSTEEGMTVIGSAADGEEAVREVARLNPDVILLDLQMPRKSGIEAIAEIKEQDPQARILVLTSFSDDEKVFAAIKAGAMGYILKDASPQELIAAIRNVHEGKSSLDPSIALKVIRELNKPSALPPTSEPLTERELEILQLLARGLSNQQIAEELVISERTARTHISNILAKLHLANRTQAALYALRQGIARLDDGPDSD
jgi:NarL family two-component system response regulator LiaR